MSKVAQALTIAFEFVGQKIDEYAIAEMTDDLKAYREADVLAALKRCRQELRAIKFVDIVDRIPGGHPGVEEAWATISKTLNNEYASIVWTDEMREAYGVVAPLADDPVAARMAFKEKYQALVGDARSKGQPIKWSASLGIDVNQREAAIQEAVEKGRLSIEYGKRVCPDLQITSKDTARLLEHVKNEMPKLPGQWLPTQQEANP